MKAIERLANSFGRYKGQFQKGFEDVFSTSGSHPTLDDDSAFIDMEQWGAALLEGNEPRTKKDFVKAFKGFVYICVKRNSQTVASQRLRLYVAKKEKTQKFKTIDMRPLGRQQKQWIYSREYLDKWLTKAVDVEEVTSHIWLDLIRQVNQQHNARDLKEYTVLYSDLTGECYWLLLKDGLGVPQQIWPIPSQFINPIFGDNLEEPIKGYLYQHGRTEAKLETDDVVFFTYPNPNNVFTGFSCVKGIATAVYIREQMDAMEKALFENKARIGGLLVPQENIVKQERDRLKEDFSQQYAGARKAGKLLITPKGMKLERDTMTPEEINFIKGRQMNIEETCLALDIPPSLFDTSANRATAYIGKEQYAENAILPRCDRMAQKINEKILPLYGDKLFCAFDNPVPQDRKLILTEQIGRTKAGIMTINEARAEQQLGPVEGGDVPYIDNRLMPLTGESEEEQVRRFSEKVLENVKEVLE